jgi:hypothetical protein
VVGRTSVYNCFYPFVICMVLIFILSGFIKGGHLEDVTPV